MELLYNPDQMPEEEIKATFVAREALVDALVELIKGQPDGAGVQHAVIIAPRGMGKTTVLLMVKFAIKDRGLSDQWQPVKFPEESYGVYDLADFWVETLNLIAADTADEELRQLTNNLKIKYPNNDELQEAAYAALKDWRRKHGKRLLLLVENFDLILEQINDERDNARLRDVLMNDGTLILLGGATTFFKEARAYDQPLYNFFKIYNLYDLKFTQMQELLRRRAEIDRLTDFEATLKQNTSRLRTLEYFTGGNPRLVLMLYRVVSRSDLTEVRRALEKLLDEVTPYYKAKVEALPAQQRKILDYIARISGETNEGLTPSKIAADVRLSPNQVSSQLKRLSELGYVRAANLRGRSSYYTLSEPLYAIWHQMRFGRNVREKMRWLISFIRVWYSIEEFGVESERLQARFYDYVDTGNKNEACDVLEHQILLADATEDSPVHLEIMKKVVAGYGVLSSSEVKPEEALKYLELALNIKPGDHKFLLKRGRILIEIGRYMEAVDSFNNALKTSPNCTDSWYGLGEAFFDMRSYEDAIKSYRHVNEIKPGFHAAWCSQVAALNNLGRCEEALAIWDYARETKPECSETWYCHAFALNSLGRYEEAIASYDHVLKIKPSDHRAWNNRGRALGRIGKYEEAIASYDQALEIKPDFDTAWNSRGHILSHLGRYEEALVDYDRALEINPDNKAARYNHSLACLKLFADWGRQGKFDAAKQKWNEALAFGSKSNNKRWPDRVAEALLEVATTSRREFARKMIAEAGMDEQLFPLARAIDYLQIGDEALIEKLSPEVRGIVEEVVAKLRTTSPTK